MPNLDGTGPYGTGPYGRGMGPCRSGGRVAFGPGRRMGRGRGFWAMPQNPGAVPDHDIRSEIEALEARLKFLKQRLLDEGKDSP